MVELAAGLYGNIDVLTPTAYYHAPWVSMDWFVNEWVIGDLAREPGAVGGGL